MTKTVSFPFPLEANCLDRFHAVPAHKQTSLEGFSTAFHEKLAKMKISFVHFKIT